MSKENNADKPAFPARVKAMGYSNGLSKREWMATQLMAGMTSRDNVDAADCAAWSIELADELLKQLNEELGTED